MKDGVQNVTGFLSPRDIFRRRHAVRHHPRHGRYETVRI